MKTLLRASVPLGLLIIQGAMLSRSATFHSPTYLEPAFLASGLSHLEFGRFELYRVNPPLVRMIAALPTKFTHHQVDWSDFQDSAGSRAEFSIGNAFFRVNGLRTVDLVIYGRWACIPFSLLGAFVAFRWAYALYGYKSAVLCLALFVFEPNLLAHGELITPDMACTSFGIVAGFTFWNWLRAPSWRSACFAGITLGFAQLSKMSWVILFLLWPTLWLWWRSYPKLVSLCGMNRCNLRESADGSRAHSVNRNSVACSVTSIIRYSPINPTIQQLGAILAIGIYIINVGYGFDGTGSPLKSFDFISQSLSGFQASEGVGNRFRPSILGEIRIPVPRQYLLGLDAQKKDFERFSHASFLRGEWRDRGWWYYYLYGALYKIPCGILCLLVVAFWDSFRCRSSRANLGGEAVLLATASALFVVVSAQTAFSIHFRYVLPVIGLLLIFVSKSAESMSRFTPFRSLVVIAFASWTIASSLCHFPNELRYFNEIAGGEAGGRNQLLGSSYDWGQDLLRDIKWTSREFPDATLDFRMQFHDFGQILAGQSNEEQLAKASNQSSQQKITLISADCLSQWQYHFAVGSSGSGPRELIEIIHIFPSGSALVFIRPKIRE